MKAWNFSVKSDPEEVIKKLDASFGSGDRFVYNMDQAKNGPAKFSLRKRVLYPDQIMHRNRIIVQGNVSTTGAVNESKVELSFTQHVVTTVTTYMFLGAGVFALILAIGKRPSAYLPGLLLLAIGIAFWVALRGKFEKDIQKYKTLFAGILEIR